MKFDYNPEITLGNLLQIISILAGIFVGYSTLVQANAVQDRVLTEHAQRIDESRQSAREERSEIRNEIKELAKDIHALDNKFSTYALEEAKRRK